MFQLCTESTALDELLIAFIKRNKFRSYNIPQAYGFKNEICNLDSEIECSSYYLAMNEEV